jgi:endonuclease/exonuclease/phosphatase family metal-dependent hydrolase
MKRFLRILCCAFCVVLIAALGYIIYLFATYHRLEDNLVLEVESGTQAVASDTQTFSVVTWNVGFGAYSDDFSFFMDGGTESCAYSEQAVHENIETMSALLSDLQADFIFLQEVDTDAKRSHHVDEAVLFTDALPDYTSIFCQNYDSAYLFYPFLQPHGKARSGLLTLSSYTVDSAQRRRLPVETGLTKFLDLDRCYSVSRVPLENGNTLCLYNVHLSAYSSDGSINTQQLQMLMDDMAADLAEGSFVICGGDFNMDLLEDSGAIFGIAGNDFTWARPFPKELLAPGFQLVNSCDPSAPVPSCRNANEPYTPGHTFVLTADGFIVSDNVTVESASVIDCGFACSDHNPVYMTFKLGK